MGMLENPLRCDITVVLSYILSSNCYKNSLKIHKKTCLSGSFFDAVDLQLHQNQGSSAVFCYEFCKNTFFAKRQGQTAFNFSYINSSEGGIGKRNCKL